ncbi:phosphate/phosphite/phosphonate ABC transporter substrate-binding protein [Xanthobacter tagetidis]|uniref:Phosphate/phosphite/phosphonate ABC transporter substrate-binding protein n=1 Tax=Xanthobacter tagetidis TaxID=60216 RepID=A0A3L7A493_9HYPH|nr:phosphate/phosphite/phosphonate ABC transporter substrate-binding protein [Xanthobacter tagetidis]MBB6310072.1 phosphonate transport system substrate-binding protein [Xanthobacter tagetidis]RLP75173.1 phosphate/phosphite/phosphonate ABC transporter substrate-binding protein [Xanthobacter tagetidis]
MSQTRRTFIAAGTGLIATTLFTPAIAQPKKTLRFGVGPLLPNPTDTKKAYMPLFAHLAKELGADFDLVATTDWAGMAVAMGSDQLDLAWMGPWGYVIANNATNCQAVATVKYDDKPIYYGIIVGRPDLKVTKFPDDTKGLSMSFADVGSTSGWLIPSYYAKEVWKIDPKTFWKYSEGATHAANEVAVASGQVDMATDFDRNRNAMIAAGRMKEDANKIIWTSDPLPNDAIAVAASAPKEFGARVQQILTAITQEQAKSLLPARYTGFVPATHASYDMIEKAGIAVGKIKPKA